MSSWSVGYSYKDDKKYVLLTVENEYPVKTIMSADIAYEMGRALCSYAEKLSQEEQDNLP